MLYISTPSKITPIHGLTHQDTDSHLLFKNNQNQCMAEGHIALVTQKTKRVLVQFGKTPGMICQYFL